MEQVTTMAIAIISVWLTPVRMVGRACGIWTLNRHCIFVEPNERAASTTSGSTCLIPWLVSLITGTIA